MKQLYFSAIMLLLSLVASAQTVNSINIDISAIDDAYTLQAIDVAKTASAVADPLLWFDNPFKGESFDTAEISFDVFNYDDIHVLGSLFAFYGVEGRMYFSNGSYLGYNAVGGWFDANMESFAMDSNFIENNVWKNIKLQFTPTGYSMSVDGVFAFDQNSTEVAIGGDLTDYTNVISFLQNVDTLVFGTGSWWSDNKDAEGNYYDVQNSYIKNFTLIAIENSISDSTKIDISAIDDDFTPQAIDVATCASTLAAPAVSMDNPFKDSIFDVFKISFDVYNYHTPDSIKVLGALLAAYDTAAPTGRMYFSNGSYLGYNATGGWFDANMDNFGIDSNFLGTGNWKNIELEFDAKGFSMYVDDNLAYDQSSTYVSMAGDLTDYSNVLTFFQNATSLIIGTGSWWSDNTRPDGSYFDAQFSYMKNITLTTIENPKDAITGGNMEDSTAWTTYWRSDNADTGSFKFNYTVDVPAAGDGGCLKINAFGNSGAYAKQAVTIKPGHSYALTGAFKNISTDPVTNSWSELILTSVEPIEDTEFGSGDAFVLYAKNSWMAPPYNDLDIDGTFEENFNYQGGTYTKKLTIPNTVTNTDWYVLIKAGSANGNGVATPNIEYLFDNISLLDLGIDKEAPSAPANLAADKDTITWDASTDNIGVYTYILYDGATAVDTISAIDTVNTYTFTNLTAGTHTLGVVAADQSGNESTMSTVDIDIIDVGIKANTISEFAIFPNPSTGIVTIESDLSTATTLEVYSITGKLIMSDEFTGSYRLDMTKTNSGLYLIYLKTINGVQVEKLILR